MKVVFKNTKLVFEHKDRNVVTEAKSVDIPFGATNISVESSDYYAGGKNIIVPKFLDGEQEVTSLTLNGITASWDENGYLHLNGTASAQTGISSLEPTSYPSAVGKYVTISVEKVSGTYTGNTIGVYAQSGGGMIHASTTINLNEKKTNTSSQIASQTGYIRFRFNIPSGTVCTNLVVKPMIEIGTAATEFKKYSSQPVKKSARQDFDSLEWAGSGDDNNIEVHFTVQ